MSGYEKFLESRRQVTGYGFDPIWMPDFLFDYQKELVRWALWRGRGGIFADCGLGKTPIQLVWSENVVRHTNRPVLIATPLAVSYQLLEEAEKFGVEARRSVDGSVPHTGVVVTNYERLHHFNPSDFSGLVCDESSILKNFNGTTKAIITEAMRKMHYRLLCTATAAPNDYTELGTSSEAIGELGYMDMLSRFFKNDRNTATSQGREFGKAMDWRLKGHAETAFWQWVASWSRAIRRPSDYGYSDDGFKLPALTEYEHLVEATTVRDGFLFDLPALTLEEQREERRRTIPERCDEVVGITDDADQWIVWCHLNDESSRLASSIDGAVEVSGSDSDEQKEESLLAFARGETRVLVTKPKIGAWGLNLQRCASMCFFPSHSYEEYYQGVRRCYRFGQKRPVSVHTVATVGEKRVIQNRNRKAAIADEMFDRLMQHMSDALAIDRKDYEDTHTRPIEVPSWL